MTLQRSEILRRISHLAPLCSEFSCQISRPAKAKEIIWRQKQVGRVIPQGMVDLAGKTASRIKVHWELDERVGEAPLFEDGFPSSGDFEFNFYETSLSPLEGWQHSFTHWQEYRSSPNPFEYDDLFPVAGLMNGDLIVELVGEKERGAIYYLDHEGGSGDWMRLAESYDAFISTVAALWFPDFEWHDSLEHFYDRDARKLSADTPFSRRWTAFISERHAVDVVTS